MEGLCVTSYYEHVRAFGRSNIKLRAKTWAFRGFVKVDGPELRIFWSNFGITEPSTILSPGFSTDYLLDCLFIAKSNCSSSSSSKIEWCTLFSFSPLIDNSNSTLYLPSSVNYVPFHLFFFHSKTAFFFPLFLETGLNAGPWEDIPVVGSSAFRYHALLNPWMVFNQSTTKNFFLPRYLCLSVSGNLPCELCGQWKSGVYVKTYMTKTHQRS